MDILGYHIPSLVGVGATFASVYTAFAKFDADQSDKNRTFVRNWLLGFKADDRQWVQFFKELFAKVFGDRHLSAKCIGRSTIFSATLIGAIWTYRYFYLYSIGEYDLLVLVPGAPLFWAVSAIVADYLSLWKTRVLLTGTSLLGSGLAAIAVVVGDAFATIVISLLIILGPQFLALWLNVDYSGGPEEREALLRFLWHEVSVAFSWPHLENSIAGTTRLLLLAPLLTSAWLWVYLVVAYAMRAANYLPSWLRPLSKVMDFEFHPVRTIEYVAATVSALIVGIMTLI